MARCWWALVLVGLLVWPGQAGPGVPSPRLTPVPYLAPSPAAPPSPPAAPSPSPAPKPSPPGPPPPPGYAFITQFDHPARIPSARLPWRVGSTQATPVLQQSLDLWNGAGQGTLLVYEPALERCDLVLDWSGQRLPADKVSATWWDAGLGYKEVRGITIDARGLPAGNLVQILAHELGHVLGLEHSYDAQDMMAERMHSRRYYALSGPRLTARDREALEWLYRQTDFVPIRGRLDSQTD